MNRITKFAVLLFVFSLTIFLTHQSLAAGFSKGNEIQTIPISGSVFVQCPAQPGLPGGPTSQFFSCAAILWSPDIVDYFVGPQGVQADKVTLVATHADGSKRDKSSDYDSSKGRSKSQFNLGIATLTQKPLLKDGRNQIHFVMSEGGKTVTEGDFDVNLSEQSEMRCSPGNYYLPSAYDCQNQSFICDRYFDDHNNCQ